MKNVLIKIKGTQTVGEQSDTVELTTVGKMGEKNGRVFITYSEEQTEIPATLTTLKIAGEKSVTIQRSGGSTNRLFIEKGQRNLSLYETGYGVLTIGVFGEKIVNEINETGGRLTMSYTLDANSSLISRNKLEIHIKETGDNDVKTCS